MCTEPSRNAEWDPLRLPDDVGREATALAAWKTRVARHVRVFQYARAHRLIFEVRGYSCRVIGVAHGVVFIGTSDAHEATPRRFHVAHSMDLPDWQYRPVASDQTTAAHTGWEYTGFAGRTEPTYHDHCFPADWPVAHMFRETGMVHHVDYFPYRMFDKDEGGRCKPVDMRVVKEVASKHALIHHPPPWLCNDVWEIVISYVFLSSTLVCASTPPRASSRFAPSPSSTPLIAFDFAADV